MDDQEWQPVRIASWEHMKSHGCYAWQYCTGDDWPAGRIVRVRQIERHVRVIPKNHKPIGYLVHPEDNFDDQPEIPLCEHQILAD
jgi:hypothetical protein